MGGEWISTESLETKQFLQRLYIRNVLTQIGMTTHKPHVHFTTYVNLQQLPNDTFWRSLILTWSKRKAKCVFPQSWHPIALQTVICIPVHNTGTNPYLRMSDVTFQPNFINLLTWAAVHRITKGRRGHIAEKDSHYRICTFICQRLVHLHGHRKTRHRSIEHGIGLYIINESFVWPDVQYKQCVWFPCDDSASSCFQHMARHTSRHMARKQVPLHSKLTNSCRSRF